MRLKGAVDIVIFFDFHKSIKFKKKKNFNVMEGPGHYVLVHLLPLRHCMTLAKSCNLPITPSSHL